MRKDIVFVVGPVVANESFLGRRNELEKLRLQLCDFRRSKGLSITGPNRIGKSSLIQKLISENLSALKNTLLVVMSLNEYGSLNTFLMELAVELKEQITKAGIQDKCIQESLEDLVKSDTSSEPEYNTCTRKLRRVFTQLKTLSWRVILVIDEFDQSMKLFTEQHHFGFFRNLIVNYSVTEILISRRKLYMIERCSNEGSSTFHGVFDSFSVTEFSEEDMVDFWTVLSYYDIFEDDQMRQTIRQYAGTHPYLLSFYGNRMAQAALEGKQVTADTVVEINQKERDWVEQYYRDLCHRLESDGHMEKLIGTLWGPSFDVYPADIHVLCSLGYLKEQEDGTYCCFCQDFMEYLERLPMDVPAWEGIMGAERTLKRFVNKIYSELRRLRWSTLEHWDDILQRNYPELGDILNLQRVKPAIKKNHNRYHQDSTVVDALELSLIVEIITRNWEKFSGLFNCHSQPEQVIWKYKLGLIVNARNAYAHDHPKFLTEAEKLKMKGYCQEVIQLGEHAKI